MDLTRRRFSIAALASAFAAACRHTSGDTTVAPDVAPPSAPARTGPPSLLVLGGTGFLGPHVVEAALALGCEVTLFNRGKTNPQLFPELEKLVGDRNGDLSALKDRSWTWVVDTSAYFPRQVEASAGLLADRVERYLFVSSVSAYASLAAPGVDETAASAPMPEPYSEEMPTYYGPLKAACERAAEAAMPGRAVTVRPGLIVGPGDPTDRFTYWPVRVAKGGDVLAPNDPRDPVQFVDVRDLSAFMLRLLADDRGGIYNVVGPKQPETIGNLLQACKDVSGSDARFVWAPSTLLADNDVQPWMELTVWVPTDDPESGGINRVDVGKALAAGLRHRPMRETIADTLAWWNALPSERREQPRAGLPAEREAAVLAALASSTQRPAA